MQSDNYWKKNQGQRLFEEALAHEANGKTAKAIDSYVKSLKSWPRNAQAQYNLGIALATQGDIEQAIRAWKRAIWLEERFKFELIEAFDLNDESRETVIDNEFYSDFAQAA
jgi:tetratricopeptide (TPR) repeat protein